MMVQVEMAGRQWAISTGGLLFAPRIELQRFWHHSWSWHDGSDTNSIDHGQIQVRKMMHVQLTLTRARVRPILSANCFLKSVVGLGSLPNSCSRIVICSCVSRGRLDVSTSSPVSMGEVNCPEVCRLIIDTGPLSDPSEWNVGAALGELEKAGFDRLFLLYMASNSMFLKRRRLP